MADLAAVKENLLLIIHCIDRDGMADHPDLVMESAAALRVVLEELSTIDIANVIIDSKILPIISIEVLLLIHLFYGYLVFLPDTRQEIIRRNRQAKANNLLVNALAASTSSALKTAIHNEDPGLGRLLELFQNTLEVQ
jgi:hypothetical protein